MRASVIALIVSACAAVANAQPLPLFDYGNAGTADNRGGAPPGPEVSSRTAVGIRLEALFPQQTGVARQVLLNVGAESWTATFERLDTDANGFRSWVGTLDGMLNSHVVFTERNGVLNGLINAVGATYQVRTQRPGAYLLERVNVAALRVERDPMPGEPRTISVARDRASAAAENGTIDVLYLYTPAARSRVGDTAAMQGLVSQIVSDTNTAFARSGIAPRVRMVGVVELNFVEAPQLASDLPALRNSPEARLLRDVSRADLVQLLVASPDMEACGIAYLLSPETPDFDAFSIADVTCIAQFTPTHELAHNLGSHHAPEDGASGALFPYSYGYKDPVRGFRTLMAYPCPNDTCHRILNFSNPFVRFDDAATGTPLQDNARSINEAAPFVTQFSELIAPAGGAPPAPPIGLQSTVDGNTVTVTWAPPVTSNPASDPTSYVLQVGRAPGTANVFNASVGPVTTMSGLVPNGVYYWRVIAVNAAGASLPSAEMQFAVGACIAPSAPGSLSFSLQGHIVTLTWDEAAPGATYLVEAGSGPGLANLVNAAVGMVTAVSTAAPPGTYYVRVRAQSACGGSPPSLERMIVVP